MKLFDFLDIKYRLTAAKLQQEYSPFTDGKAKAAHGLIGFCRTLSKWFHIPIILGEYLLVTMGLRKPPVGPELPKAKLQSVPNPQ